MKIKVEIKVKDCMNNIGLPHFADKQYLESNDVETIKEQVKLFSELFGESFVGQEAYKVANEIIEKLS